MKGDEKMNEQEIAWIEEEIKKANLIDDGRILVRQWFDLSLTEGESFRVRHIAYFKQAEILDMALNKLPDEIKRLKK